MLFFIVTGIYTFAQETARLVAIYEDQRMGRTKYTLRRNVQHVVVTGNPSAVQVMDFIREFFHPDHEALFSTTSSNTPTNGRLRRPQQFHQQAHIVVLMEFQDEDTEREVQNTLQEYIRSHPQYHGKVTMLAGSPLQEVDLNRAKVHDALAVRRPLLLSVRRTHCVGVFYPQQVCDQRQSGRCRERSPRPLGLEPQGRPHAALCDACQLGEPRAA